MLVGQVSGIAFIFAMDAFKSPDTGAMTLPLVVLVGLLVLSIGLCLKLRESSLLVGSTTH